MSTKQELEKTNDKLEHIIELLILLTAPTMQQYISYYMSQDNYDEVIRYLEEN